MKKQLNLSQQIKSLKKQNVVLILCCLFVSILLLWLSHYLYSNTDQTKLALSMLLALPFSLSGGVLQIKANKKRIKELMQILLIQELEFIDKK